MKNLHSEDLWVWCAIAVAAGVTDKRIMSETNLTCGISWNELKTCPRIQTSGQNAAGQTTDSWTWMLTCSAILTCPTRTSRTGWYTNGFYLTIPVPTPCPHLGCTLLSMVLSAPSCHVSRKHHYYCCPIAMFFAEATKINSIFLLCAVKLCWVFYTNLYYKLQMCVIKCNYRLYIYIY